jgi:hypothetical protein
MFPFGNKCIMIVFYLTNIKIFVTGKIDNAIQISTFYCKGSGNCSPILRHKRGWETISLAQ